MAARFSLIEQATAAMAIDMTKAVIEVDGARVSFGAVVADEADTFARHHT